MCHATVPAMRAQRWGRVVAITSIAARQPIPNLILSNTARAGVTGFLKTLAREVAADGVTVNSLQPGLHATERITGLHGDTAGLGRDRSGRTGRRAGRLRSVRGVRVLGGGGLLDRRGDPDRRWRRWRTAMIRHVSVLTFVDDATDEQIDAVAAALRALPDRIPQLRDYRVGRDLEIDPGNSTFVVIGDFDDADGYRAYRDHPDHIAAARAHILPILAGRQAAQYTI